MSRLYNRLSGPVAPPGAVFIGRPSKWGNPFVIGRDLLLEIANATV